LRDLNTHSKTKPPADSSSSLGNRSKISPPDNSSAGDCLKVLDINVWSGLDYLGYVSMGAYESKAIRLKRYQALLHQIESLSPDVIGVHEANSLPAYTRKLARDLGYDHYSHVGVGGIRMGPLGLPWNLREGDGILVKHEHNLSHPARQQLSGGPVGNFFTFNLTDATQVVGVQITFKSQPLFIFTTHWHASVIDCPEYLAKLKELKNEHHLSGEKYRAALQEVAVGAAWRLAEAEGTIDFVRRIAGEHPYILMGDFNTIEGTGEISKLLEFGAVDTFRTLNPESAGYTWEPRTNLNIRHYYSKDDQRPEPSGLYDMLYYTQEMTPQRLDFIFVGPRSLLKNEQISIVSSRVVLDGIIDGVHASDHFGIYSEIKF
jgi:endonuclease/exonuclease/phosphatase family metal-dependent hydrolase